MLTFTSPCPITFLAVKWVRIVRTPVLSISLNLSRATKALNDAQWWRLSNSGTQDVFLDFTCSHFCGKLVRMSDTHSKPNSMKAIDFGFRPYMPVYMTSYFPYAPCSSLVDNRVGLCCLFQCCSGSSNTVHWAKHWRVSVWRSPSASAVEQKHFFWLA